MQLPPLQSSKSKVGIYVHFPWCLEKCPYCDFLSVKVPGADGSAARARDLIPHEHYADAVIAELESRAARLDLSDWEVGSVFFGGGTPSLWAPSALGRVLAAVQERLPLGPALEVTAECNPTSVDEGHFRSLLEAGVNRVSIGVQATDDDRLRFLGRLHNEADGLRALRAAQAAGVPRVSADLIFGVYKQSPEAALSDARAVAATGVTHLSCYALTIEENTRFGSLRRAGRLPLLEEELVARSFEAVSQELSALGFGHYEVSNYAKPGQESRHNLGYWQGDDYLGLGTGAFGTVTLPRGRLRYRNDISPDRYMRAFGEPPGDSVDPFAELVSESESLAPETSLREAILLGLRLEQGIVPDALEARFGAPFWTVERRAQADRLIGQGKLREEGGRVSIPHDRWLLADGIIVDLM